VNANSTSRAGSPLLFGLAPRGVFRASGVATRAVGSYPTFSPLPNETSCSKTSRRFTCAMPPCCVPPAVHFLWHFPWANWPTPAEACATQIAPLALPGALPFTLSPPLSGRRVTLMTQDGVRTFLPPGHLAMTRPAITRPARQLHYNLEFSR